MKKILLLACAMLWCGGAAAGVKTETLPSDSTQAVMGIKKMEMNTMDKAIDIKNAEPKKAEKPKLEKKEIKANVAPVVENAPLATESRSTAEEMKNMAKRESGSTAAKKSVTPAVSYPYYPGGNIAIREWVRKNQQYPPECKRERLRGRVEVMVAIAPDGTPHSATISKSSGNVHMDAEALRIAEMMPKWQPAPESEDPQGIDYIIFVNFRPGR